MLRLFDAGEAREFLRDRLTNLLNRYGTGVAEIDEISGWRFSHPTTDTILVENVEESTMPRLLISIEVSN